MVREKIDKYTFSIPYHVVGHSFCILKVSASVSK